jgi:hypothetical protein
MALPAKWRVIEDNGEPQTEFDKGYEQASQECADELDATFNGAAQAATGGEREPDYTPGALDQSAPARIWLQIDTAGDNADRGEAFPADNWEHVSWCQRSIGGLEIEYVRADLAATPAGGGDALSADLVRVLRSVASEPDNRGWLASISPQQAREILRLAPAVEVALDANGLLPCPFCGAAAMGVVSVMNAMPERHSITCSDERCLATVEGRTARRAALMWNRRLASSPARVGDDTARLDFIEDAAADLCCHADPIADTGDADVYWQVATHHMAPPRRRVIATEATAREAIDAAMLAAAPAQEPSNQGSAE